MSIDFILEMDKTSWTHSIHTFDNNTPIKIETMKDEKYSKMIKYYRYIA